VLTPAPVTSAEALAAGLCNELGCGHSFLCHNLTGLWLLQRFQAEWQQKGESHSYDALVELASRADEEGAVIHPDDPCFLAPQDMGDAIRAYCARTGQLPPRGPGATTRAILASLALSCRHALARLTDVAGRRVDVLHVVGGGARNPLLCQFAANAVHIRVVAGPAEATAAGNALVQAWARGCLSSPAEIREVVRHSTDLVEYRPHDVGQWDALHAKYLQVLAQASG
jgi:rhamnulokinase